ncbi:hypothetical protein HELRODRAFT_163640 [Helobdella robusta]|uniref:Tetraspanin n=1 Tax=Helobdella robusta TaxID=6412 RepID=T1EUA8_HELRO|nr:hypothetical protein HELRODRAFT_163640 [Helobdella robusta]ESN96563.1 hypothetical protein HELRODRAFT_163640 [Helobdella robusta]
MSGSVKCLQVFVALLCIVQFVLGIVFLILGGMAYNKSGAGLNAHSAAIFLLAVGCFIVLVALFGLCGAIAKNSCLLIVTQCCGYDDVKDWESNPNFKGGKLPISCCSNSTFTATACSTTSSDGYHQMVCRDVIEIVLKGMLYGFGIIAAITAIALFLTLLLASILTSQIRKEYNPV